MPWLGGLEDIRAVLDRHTVDMVIIALPHADYSRLGALLDAIGDEPVTIHVVPDLFRLASLRGGVEEFEAMPFIHLRESPLYGWNQRAQARLRPRLRRWRCSSLSAAAARLIAVAIKLIVARRPCSTARSAWASTAGASTCSSSARCGRTPRRTPGPVWATADDPRRTALGAFLRRLSLDELPQLINVLRGEMSLVGPRPERPVFVEQFRRTVPGYMLRHKVKSGITGWAQVNGWRGNTSHREAHRVRPRVHRALVAAARSEDPVQDALARVSQPQRVLIGAEPAALGPGAAGRPAPLLVMLVLGLVFSISLSRDHRWASWPCGWCSPAGPASSRAAPLLALLLTIRRLDGRGRARARPAEEACARARI